MKSSFAVGFRFYRLFALGRICPGGRAKIAFCSKPKAPFWSAMEKGATKLARTAGSGISSSNRRSRKPTSACRPSCERARRPGIQALVIAPPTKDALARSRRGARGQGDQNRGGSTRRLPEQSRARLRRHHQPRAGEAAGRLLAFDGAGQDEVTFFSSTIQERRDRERRNGASTKLREGPGIVGARRKSTPAARRAWKSSELNCF